MPNAACLSKHTCLARRDATFRKPPAFTWGEECTSCWEGTCRRMDSFVPDPDPDIAPQPVRGPKPKVKKPLPVCACGKVLTRGAKICKPCRGKARTALMPKKCTTPGCRNKARPKGLCCTCYWKGRPAPYHRGKGAGA